MKAADIKGIITPMLTPMNPDETVNYDALRGEVERLITGGVHGIFCYGTNGECYILSEKEKTQILEVTLDQVKGRVPVYAGTGCISTAQTIRLSQTAEKMGADALSIITPSFAAASQQELYDHYREVAKHVTIPIIMYNIPARTGNALLPETVEKLAREVDVIAGAKDSSGSWDNLLAYIQRTRDIGRDFQVLAGNDGLILSALRAGGAGAIAGCSNVYPRLLSSIYDHFAAGNEAAAQQAQDAVSGFRAVLKYGNPNTIIKKAAALLGNPVGDCRRPFNGLSQEGRTALEAVLKEYKEKGYC